MLLHGQAVIHSAHGNTGGERRVKRTSADSSWADLSFWGEVLGLALAAPFFYLSGRLPVWGPLVGLLLIGGTWVWRKRRLGVWFPRTPADWPLLLLILLLPLAVWVAPADLRARYAWPRALILFWNLALFALAATHSRRGNRLRTLTAGGLVLLGAGIAAAALFGTHWDTKSPLLTALLERLPRLPTALFGAADEGFSPNQVAGTLLYALPPALAWLAVAVRRRRPLPIAALALACAVMGLVMAATQSRAGLAGLAAALLILLLWPWRWGRRLLGIGAAAILAALIFLPIPDLLTALDDTTKVQGAYGSLSIAGRMEIWARAARALADFPLTGVGLGAFRGVVHQLYPLYLIPPDYDIAHAHNFFLQSGLDLGLLGLVAVLALYLLAGERCWTLDRTPLFDGHRAWSAGLLAALLGQAVYSLADAVALGSKTNLLLWLLLGLIFGLSDSSAFPRRGMRSADEALVTDARLPSADLVPLREALPSDSTQERADG